MFKVALKETKAEMDKTRSELKQLTQDRYKRRYFVCAYVPQGAVREK